MNKSIDISRGQLHDLMQEKLLMTRKENLLPKLIAQLNRDFTMTGIDAALPENLHPDQLYDKVMEVLKITLETNLLDIRNLLYRIDVSEKAVNQIEVLSIEEITILVLKRESEKVWFQYKYS